MKSAHGWKTRYGRLIVKAITKGIDPFECREQVEALVNVTEGAESDPYIVWRMANESGKRQVIFEGGQNQFFFRGVRETKMAYTTKKLRDLILGTPMSGAQGIKREL